MATIGKCREFITAAAQEQLDRHRRQFTLRAVLNAGTERRGMGVRRLDSTASLCKNVRSGPTQGELTLEAFMRNFVSRIPVGWALAIVCMAHVATAQAPPAGGQATGTAPASIVVANPTYTSVPLEITVNRPAAEVWRRVGKYCDVGEWMQVACTITSGKDGEFGAVRSVGNEILVGKSELSYTYTQPVREGRPYNLYHGTLEARSLTATTSKLIYTLVFDNSMLADDAAREQDKAQRAARFMRALENMKILAEGGTLPVPPERGPRGTTGTAPPRQ
jgi:hypothetical protein